MIIVLIGPPGSGKGTQGRLLAKKLNLPHISTGDIFREMAKSANKEVALIEEYMKQGRLVPSELVNKLVEKYLSDDQYNIGYILDGYPRNLGQAKFLQNFIKQDIKVILFDVDEQIIIKRILARFNCTNCGQIYNSYFVKPKIDDVCDVCGGKNFVHRRDDDEQAIKQRIKEYNAETYPLIEYYKNEADFYVVDASKDKIEIELSLEKLLKMI